MAATGPRPGRVYDLRHMSVTTWFDNGIPPRSPPQACAASPRSTSEPTVASHLTGRAAVLGRVPLLGDAVREVSRVEVPPDGVLLDPEPLGDGKDVPLDGVGDRTRADGHAPVGQLGQLDRVSTPLGLLGLLGFRGRGRWRACPRNTFTPMPAPPSAPAVRGASGRPRLGCPTLPGGARAALCGSTTISPVFACSVISTTRPGFEA